MPWCLGHWPIKEPRYHGSPYLNRNAKVVSIFYPGDQELHPHFDLEGQKVTL